ncbi:MAG: hypothetical protein HOV81_43650 [Kofleriaceae bacterium]|nr:hypothetical protein [Kofleriaceae bacterium]
MRAALCLLVALAACNDLRDFQGEWSGSRIGEAPPLKVGIADGAHAVLSIDSIDKHGLAGRLTIDGVVSDAEVASLPGAEADALATMSFSGAPMRVYLAFVDAPDGEVMVIIALYDSRRVEIRALRGGATPLYAIFALSEGS